VLVGIDVRYATGTGERDGALAPVDAHMKRGSTLGADKGYDTRYLGDSSVAKKLRHNLSVRTLYAVLPKPKNKNVGNQPLKTPGFSHADAL
jgi:hypothetical protein